MKVALKRVIPSLLAFRQVDQDEPVFETNIVPQMKIHESSLTPYSLAVSLSNLERISDLDRLVEIFQSTMRDTPRDWITVQEVAG